MATTALIVEVVVIGVLALGWMSLFVFVLGSGTIEQVRLLVESVKDLSVLLAFTLLATAYSFGWIVNFVTERAFKLLFQRRIRGSVFPDDTSYENARIQVLQCGSAELVRELLVDRHIIRLGRAGVLNFALLGLGLLIYGYGPGGSVVKLLGSASIGLSILSFGQWWTRYESHYKRIDHIAEMLSIDSTLSPTVPTSPQRLVPARSARYEMRLAGLRALYPRAYEKWTDNEDDQLKQKFREGASMKDLSTSLQRQPNAIRARLIRLGLKIGTNRG